MFKLISFRGQSFEPKFLKFDELTSLPQDDFKAGKSLEIAFVFFTSSKNAIWDQLVVDIKINLDYLSIDTVAYDEATNQVCISGDKNLETALNHFLKQFYISVDWLCTLKTLFPDTLVKNVFHLWMATIHFKLTRLTGSVENLKRLTDELSALDTEGAYKVPFLSIWKQVQLEFKDKFLCNEVFTKDSDSKWDFWLVDLADFARDSQKSTDEQKILLKLLRWKLALEAWGDNAGSMVIDPDDKRLKLIERYSGLSFYACNGVDFLGYEIEFKEIHFSVSQPEKTTTKMILHNVNSITLTEGELSKGLTPAAIFWVHYMVCMDGLKSQGINLDQYAFDGSMLSRVGSFIPALQAKSTLEQMIAVTLCELIQKIPVVRSVLFELSFYLKMAQESDRSQYLEEPWSIYKSLDWCRQFTLNNHGYERSLLKSYQPLISALEQFDLKSHVSQDIYSKLQNVPFSKMTQFTPEQFNKVFPASTLKELPEDFRSMITLPTVLRGALNCFGSSMKYNSGKLVGLELLTRLFRVIQEDGSSFNNYCVSDLRDSILGENDKYILDLSKLFLFSENVWSLIRQEDIKDRVQGVQMFIETHGFEIFFWCLIFFERLVWDVEMKDLTLPTYMNKLKLRMQTAFYPLYFKELCSDDSLRHEFNSFLKFMECYIPIQKFELSGDVLDYLTQLDHQRQVQINRYKRNFGILNPGVEFSRDLLLGLRPYIGLTEDGYIPSSQRLYEVEEKIKARLLRENQEGIFAQMASFMSPPKKRVPYDFKHALTKFIDQKTREDGAALVVEVNFPPDIIAANARYYVDACRGGTDLLDVVLDGEPLKRYAAKASQWMRLFRM